MSKSLIFESKYVIKGLDVLCATNILTTKKGRWKMPIRFDIDFPRTQRDPRFLPADDGIRWVTSVWDWPPAEKDSFENPPVNEPLSKKEKKKV